MNILLKIIGYSNANGDKDIVSTTDSSAFMSDWFVRVVKTIPIAILEENER